MVLAAQVAGPTSAPLRNAGMEKVHSARPSASAPEKRGRIPKAVHWLRSETWLIKHVAAAVIASAQTAPGSRQRRTPATATGNAIKPRAKLIRAMDRKASKPARAPVCAPLSALKNKSTLAIRSSPVSAGAFSVAAASVGAQASRASEMSPPDRMAAAQPRAIIRPARSGSRRRNSATYLVAVTPSPRPAKIPSIPTVLWSMPYAPNCPRPSRWAVTTDAAKFAPWETTAPSSDQTAPLANRPRRESAAHMARAALAAGSHDLVWAGTRSGQRDRLPATDMAEGVSGVPGLLVISIVFSVIT